MKKAIFGGSFDPPHIGHLAIITEALSSLDIDELIVVPAFLNPFKSKSYAPAQLRLQWLKAMTDKLPKVKISSFEVDQNRAVASIETVRHFKTEDDEIYLIVGADNLASLSQWNSFEALDKMVTWVVATRDNIKIPEKYLTLNVDHDISATRLREQVQEAYLDRNIAQEIIAYYSDISSKK